MVLLKFLNLSGSERHLGTFDSVEIHSGIDGDIIVASIDEYNFGNLERRTCEIAYWVNCCWRLCSDSSDWNKVIIGTPQYR